jgi:hypothetical protein
LVPPTSAGSGGGSGVVDVGVVDVGGVVDVVAELDVVAVPDVVDVVVDVAVWGPWKSSHDSLRTVLPPELTTRALELTVYVMPSFTAVNAPPPELEADSTSLAPSRIRTPRYSYPLDVLQIATRELSVLPNSTAASEQRAVEST